MGGQRSMTVTQVMTAESKETSLQNPVGFVFLLKSNRNSNLSPTFLNY